MLHIDCTTPEKIKAFCYAMQKPINAREPTDLGEAAVDAGVAGIYIAMRKVKLSGETFSLGG